MGPAGGLAVGCGLGGVVGATDGAVEELGVGLPVGRGVGRGVGGAVGPAVGATDGRGVSRGRGVGSGPGTTARGVVRGAIDAATWVPVGTGPDGDEFGISRLPVGDGATVDGDGPPPGGLVGGPLGRAPVAVGLAVGVGTTATSDGVGGVVRCWSSRPPIPSAITARTMFRTPRLRMSRAR